MTATAGSVAFRALGTTALILVTEATALDEARRLAVREIEAVDAACSRFRLDSELTRVNAARGRSLAVSPLFLETIEEALRAARLTDGAVDPTVGTAVKVLGYDRDFARIAPDGPPLQVTVRAVPGWRTVRIDRSRATVRVPSGVELDLGATAKASCADRAALKAAASTGAGVLVSLGGDIAVAGPPPPDGWTVRVADDHSAPPDAPGQTVLVHSGGLATSGASARCWTRGGRRLHHLVDPVTGWAATGPWRTVSVAAASCVDANTASTAAVVLGSGAVAWLERKGLPARLVATDGSPTTLNGWPPDEGGGT